jgi:hypothetical protein
LEEAMNRRTFFARAVGAVVLAPVVIHLPKTAAKDIVFPAVGGAWGTFHSLVLYTDDGGKGTGKVLLATEIEMGPDDGEITITVPKPFVAKRTTVISKARLESRDRMFVSTLLGPPNFFPLVLLETETLTIEPFRLSFED